MGLQAKQILYLTLVCEFVCLRVIYRENENYIVGLSNDNFNILKGNYNKLCTVLLPMKRQFMWRWSHFHKL